jgi:16S rRNA (guanine1207-N2)-methyltransferase
VVSRGAGSDEQHHYFEASPSVASRPAVVELSLPDVQLTLGTDRGVFGGSGVDPGTKFLLLDGPRPDAAEAGDLLDLGCGYGPIALTLAARAPRSTVWAVDVNERARALCAANAEAGGLANIRVAAPDEVPDDVRFAGIWSNPPIRIGKAALHELLLAWLARLAPGAEAHLVVHKHLGSDSLARWLTEQGHPTSKLRSRAGYRLLDVQGPAA